MRSKACSLIGRVRMSASAVQTVKAECVQRSVVELKRPNKLAI